MSEQVTRLLALVPYLQARPGSAVADVAEHFGVTPKQLRADLQVLWMCGLPGMMPDDMIEIDMDAVEDDGVIYLTNAEVLSAPLRLTQDEALSLTLALTAVRDLADAETSGAVESALAKLRTAVGERAIDAVGAELASAPVDVRTVLTDAIAAQQRVRLVYDGLRRSSEPVVEPARIFVRDGIAYLQAFSLEADDWRTYRLERIASAEALGQSFIPRPVPDVGASWLDTLPFTAEVTLVLGPTARWVAEYYPVRSASETPEGLRVVLGVMDWPWLTGLLLRLGDGVVSISPDEAASAARASARAALGRYR